MTRNDADTTEQTQADEHRTRRRVLGATAATLGGVALAGCSGDSGGSGTETATETPEPTTATATETPEPTNADVPVLNYALTLEHLENAFYREALSEFADDELANADVLSRRSAPSGCATTSSSARSRRSGSRSSRSCCSPRTPSRCTTTSSTRRSRSGSARRSRSSRGGR